MTKQKYKLKKELGLFQLTLYGVGIILGAGIYALIGEGAGIAGNALWLSFVIAAIIAAFTGLSYAELSSRYPKEAAEYNYTKKAFNRKSLSFMVGWIMIIATIVSASVVALGFASYFYALFGVDKLLIAALLIISLSFINYIGIKNSARFNMVSTLIESAGLFIVIIAGIFFAYSSGINVNFFEVPSDIGIAGILSATALIFFAYIGFEDVANVAEETKNARKVVPKALVFSIAISTIFYILVAVLSINTIGWQALSQSHAPLSDVVGSVIPNSQFLFSIIALFATANTVLILLIVASRVFCGMARDHSLPSRLSVIGRRGTPYIAIIFVMFLSLLAFLVGNIKTIALLTDVGIFVVYFFVNASLLALRYKSPAKTGFRAPVNIGRFPVLAFLGCLTSIFMLFYFDAPIIAMEAAVIFIGFLFYGVFKRKSGKKTRRN